MTNLNVNSFCFVDDLMLGIGVPLLKFVEVLLQIKSTDRASPINL